MARITKSALQQTYINALENYAYHSGRVAGIGRAINLNSHGDDKVLSDKLFDELREANALFRIAGIKADEALYALTSKSKKK